ncbi:MAG: hypothetical protein WCX31_00045 [Salinivirgaceae bacterium]|jgi:hypothetical protein
MNNRNQKVTHLENKIGYCEGEINKLVFELYWLTEDEIKIMSQ